MGDYFKSLDPIAKKRYVEKFHSLDLGESDVPYSGRDSDKATPNQLIVSHPIQFSPTCKVGFLNFSDPSILSKNTHYVIRCFHVVEVWQVKKSSTRIWSRSRLQCSYKINLFLSSYLPVITLECVHCTWQSAKIVFWLVFEYLIVITDLINDNFRYRPPAYITSFRWDEKLYIDLEWPNIALVQYAKLPHMTGSFQVICLSPLYTQKWLIEKRLGCVFGGITRHSYFAPSSNIENWRLR